MYGIALAGDRRVEEVAIPDPVPGPGEVVVAVKASGLCGSDLHQYRADRAGRPKSIQTGEPCIAGHEPAGVIAQVGPGVADHLARPGQRVMIHHYVGCTACEYCRSGWTQMCSSGMRLLGTDVHGAHAPYLRVPATTVVPLRDELTFEAGAAIACGTGTAWGGLRRLRDLAGATLAVFGQGPVGLSATMLGAALGARVIAIDITDTRLDQARALGAAATVNGVIDDAVSSIQAMTGGSGATLALETSGSAAAAANAMSALAPWGKVCFVGIGAEIRFNLLDHLSRQISMALSWSMSIVEQQQCADFVADHALPIDRLFTHRWSLSQAAEAYAEFDRQAAGKAVFVL